MFQHKTILTGHGLFLVARAIGTVVEHSKQIRINIEEVIKKIIDKSRATARTPRQAHV